MNHLNYHSSSYVNFEDFKGLTFTKINVGDDEILFETDTGRKFAMFHCQDCCESVTVESVVGDIEDLIGSPILLAEEVTESGESNYESYTWTFYKLATIKGYVDIRWYGYSNGYYSESVSVAELK